MFNHKRVERYLNYRIIYILYPCIGTKTKCPPDSLVDALLWFPKRFGLPWTQIFSGESSSLHLTASDQQISPEDRQEILTRSDILHSELSDLGQKGTFTEIRLSKSLPSFLLAREHWIYNDDGTRRRLEPYRPTVDDPRVDYYSDLTVFCGFNTKEADAQSMFFKLTNRLTAFLC